MIFFMAAFSYIGWQNGETISQYRSLVPWMFGYMTLVTSLRTSWKDLSQIFKNHLTILNIMKLKKE